MVNRYVWCPRCGEDTVYHDPEGSECYNENCGWFLDVAHEREED